MNKRLLFATIIWLLAIFGTFAQIASKPIEYRFKNGEKGFKDYLMRNISFPESSINNRTVGYSISRVIISPLGKVDSIEILNPIDDFIDAEVFRLLKSSSKFWLKCDSIDINQSFYIQIAFIITGFKQNFQLSNPISNKFFIDPITVTAFGIKSDLTRNPQDDDTLRIKCSELVGSGKFDEALPYVNNLIKRNPFNKEYYQLRMMIYRKQNRKDLVERDLKRISNFAESLSLDDLLKIN